MSVVLKSVIVFAGALILSSCSTINHVRIETYNPAEVTFPSDVKNVLVVNNAVPQPDSVGYVYIMGGLLQDTSRVKADSALFDACKHLGETMVDAHFFNDVLLYNGNTRKDTAFTEDKPLTPIGIDSLCAITGADAVISLDQILFSTTRNVSFFAEGYVEGTIAAYSTALYRSYVPGKSKHLAEIVVNDSLFWDESAESLRDLNQIIPDPENTLREIARDIASKATLNFVPHWQEETRWYYSNMGTSWKEATALAASKKWSDARKIWMNIYDSSRGWKSKAEAASNIALCYEIESKLTDAYEWAHRSYQLYTDHKDQSAEMTRQTNYVQSLATRLRADKKLNLQLGE
jgi:hypothetical protein